VAGDADEEPRVIGTTGQPAPGVAARLRASVDVLYREMVKFGAVGAIAFVVDTGTFNLLLHGFVGVDGPLAGKPLTAKTVSAVIATVVAWLGNRYWTFRHRRRASLRREFLLFAVMNIGGLVISLACLGFSHYVLGLTSALADNIAGNGVGLVLGTLFRFWAYRQFVFTTPDEQALLEDREEAVRPDVIDLRDHATPLRGLPIVEQPPAVPASTERRQA
jgi:putative flippase GtrA